MCCNIDKKGKSSWNKGIKRWWKAPKFKKGHTPWNKGKKGIKSPRFIGKTKSTYGYIVISKHGSLKRPFEHRIIARKLLGRKLHKEEVIHHINRIKTDNRPENLYLFSNMVEHLRHHRMLKLGKEKPKISNL